MVFGDGGKFASCMYMYLMLGFVCITISIEYMVVKEENPLETRKYLFLSLCFNLSNQTNVYEKQSEFYSDMSLHYSKTDHIVEPDRSQPKNLIEG